MNITHFFLTLLIALNSASAAAASATATTKVTLVTHAITASVTRATYTTVTAATFAAHAPRATPFVYPVSADTDFGYEQVPSAVETIKTYLMSFWGRLSEPILEFKEKLQHGIEEFMAARQPDDQGLFTVQELYERSLAEKKLKDDAAAIKLQPKETEDSGPFCPPDLQDVETPVCFLNGTLSDPFTKRPVPDIDLAALMKIMHPVTDIPSAADLPPVSSNDTDNHSYGEHYSLYVVLSSLALVVLGLALCKELTYTCVQLLIFLWEQLVADTVYLMSRKMIERLQSVSWATSPSVVDKLRTFVEKRPPSANSQLKAPFEAGPPEPHNQPGLPQSQSEVTSNAEPIQHSSMPLPMPKPIDEQLPTEPPVGDTAGAEQDSQLPAPMANTEEAVYKCDIDELSETLRAFVTYPFYISEPSKNHSFLARVTYIRAHRRIIRLQADGLNFVKEMKGLVNQGVEKLIAETDSSVIEGLSGLGGTLEKLEAAYAKGLDIERLTKNIEFIDDNYREGKLVRFKHGKMVKKTLQLLKANLANRQQCTEEFLQEVRGLCEIYNKNLERITSTSNAHGSL